MRVRIQIDVLTNDIPPLTNENLRAVRTAVGDPKALIVENRKPVGGRGITHMVQTMEDVLGTTSGSPSNVLTSHSARWFDEFHQLGFDRE